MRTVLPLLMLTVAGNLSLPAEGAPSPAQGVAPFVDELTRAVVYVDLARAEVDRLMDLAVPIVPQAAFYETPFRAELDEARAVLRAAGIDRLYVVISLADLPQQVWFLVAPCTDNLDAEALASQLPADLPKRLRGSARLTVERLDRADSGSVLFIGPEDALTRLKRNRPKPRPELAAAFATAGDAPVRAVFVPTDDDRRVVEELVPILPDWLGGGPSTVITRGLRWAAVRVDLEPEPSLRLVIESASPETTEALRRQWAKILARWGRAEPFLPEVVDRRLTLTLDKPGGGLEALQTLISPPLTREAVDRTVREQLRALGLAMHNWYDAHRSLPAQASYDADGRPLLSWRVHVLPYLGRREAARLYQQFHLDEPWDSEHNRELIKKMPDVYAMPGSKTARQGRTCYVRPVGESTSCPGSQPITFPDVTDGTSNTVLIVEVDDEHAVPWTKPADLDFDPENPARGLGGHIEGTARSVFVDGGPRLLKNLLTDPGRVSQLKAIFTRNGGEVVRSVD
ncbi:MAG TPA: DUF1559 domain-containing protein [Thermoguttaceae bacterium]|nr:DUF1559 domain-containing protein [Thermoguttaceae bacterium]